MPHIKKKHPCVNSDTEYCSAMSQDGEWGSDIEILAASTILQVPTYTFSLSNKSKSYRWLRYLPLSPPNNTLMCDYVESVKRLVHMAKPKDYHLELFHYEGCHYDLIMSVNQSTLIFPTLSDFTCNIKYLIVNTLPCKCQPDDFHHSTVPPPSPPPKREGGDWKQKWRDCDIHLQCKNYRSLAELWCPLTVTGN